MFKNILLQVLCSGIFLFLFTKFVIKPVAKRDAEEIWRKLNV